MQNILFIFPHNIALGKRIIKARTRRDVTLDDVASAVGVAKSTIQRYEHGKIQNIKIPVIHSIAKALDVNPSWIIGKSEDMDPLSLQFQQKPRLKIAF